MLNYSSALLVEDVKQGSSLLKKVLAPLITTNYCIEVVMDLCNETSTWYKKILSVDVIHARA